MRRIFIKSLAIAATVLAATPALAAEARLAWKDLDLTTDAGKAELDNRIEVAATKICSTEAVTGTRITRGPSAACLAEARSVITARIAAKTAPGRVASTAR